MTVAPTIPARTRGGGGLGTDFDCDGGLIAKTVAAHPGGRYDYETETFVTGPLCSNGKAAGSATQQDAESCMLVAASSVRRLTPRECERLQGFLDDYTLVPYRGKPAKDGPRYKALGNSMAVPVMRWIGERIKEVDKTTKGAK